MKPRTYRYNSEWMPKSFLHDYDAHIYFTDSQLPLITELHAKLQRAFLKEDMFIGDIIPEPIGPHTLPMLEVNFSQAIYPSVVEWLKHERGVLNILVHPQSGDDYLDHTEKALWLGAPVELKLEVF